MNSPDPFKKVHEICGGPQATRELRAGISEFAEEQARHFLGMNNPRWVDRAIVSPDWARSELQLCNAARTEGELHMYLHLAPYCEQLALSRADESVDGIAQIKFTMAKKWTGAKEVGSLAIKRFVARQRETVRPVGLPHSPPSTLAPAPALNGQVREEVGIER